MDRRSEIMQRREPRSESLIGQLVFGWSFSVEVFIRDSMGSRYFGSQCFWPILIIPTHCVYFADRYNMIPMVCFFYLYLAFTAMRRAGARIRDRFGDPNHSKYSGRSLLERFFPRVSETTIKKVIEPIFLICAGLVIAFIYPPLGFYLVIAGICVCLAAVSMGMRFRLRVRNMNDAVQDQYEIAERFRQLRG
ncbi:MAG: hypothetical protein U1D30_10920 [Planctomycetota bacterium]